MHLEPKLEVDEDDHSGVDADAEADLPKLLPVTDVAWKDSRAPEEDLEKNSLTGEDFTQPKKTTTACQML